MAHDRALADCVGRFAVLETRLNDHSRDLKTLERIVYGDGSFSDPGLKGNVESAVKTLSMLKEQEEDTDVKKWAIFIVLFQAVLTFIQTLILHKWG